LYESGQKAFQFPVALSVDRPMGSTLRCSSQAHTLCLFWSTPLANPGSTIAADSRVWYAIIITTELQTKFCDKLIMEHTQKGDPQRNGAVSYNFKFNRRNSYWALVLVAHKISRVASRVDVQQGCVNADETQTDSHFSHHWWLFDIQSCQHRVLRLPCVPRSTDVQVTTINIDNNL